MHTRTYVQILYCIAPHKISFLHHLLSQGFAVLDAQGLYLILKEYVIVVRYMVGLEITQ